MADNSGLISYTDCLNIIHSAPDLYLILNPQFEIVEVSDAYLLATMVKREDIIGRKIFDVFPDNPNDPAADGVKNLSVSLDRVLKLKTPDTMAVQKYDIRRPECDGGEFEERYWSPINSPVLDENNEVRYIIHRVEDVTEFIRLKQNKIAQQKVTEELRTHVDEMELEIVKRAQEIQEANKQLRNANDELQNLAHYDSLTGLANRKQLYQQTKQFITLANQTQWKIAVLFLDLDQFKLINDTLGHKIGDQLLQTVAKRLIEEIHSTDLVARLGGDEFVIVLNKINNLSDAEMVARRVLKKISEPYEIEGQQLFVSCSIGISLYPDNGDDEVTLLKHADIAMYAAKQSGRNNYTICTPEMISNVTNKVNLENELRDALAQKKFILYYQPQVELKSGLISSVEALLRFTKTDGSLALPGEFLHIAEGTGLIVAIGEWVLFTACQQFQYWKKTLTKEEHSVANHLKISVNFSARQLKEHGFLDMVKNVLRKTNFNPTNLEFEITEHLMVNDSESSIKVMRALRALGIRLVLDDFGVGYSSLSYLREFPIDKIKIDRSLFQRVPEDATDSEIIHSIIRMAHAMHIPVVAEGVETEKQINFLISHQCDLIQSHYFSKPLPADELTKLMLGNRVNI